MAITTVRPLGQNDDSLVHSGSGEPDPINSAGETDGEIPLRTYGNRAQDTYHDLSEGLDDQRTFIPDDSPAATGLLGHTVMRRRAA